MKLRLVFAGTPEFAVPCLRVAAAHNELLAVYTQPDRPSGRGRKLSASPVKCTAAQLGIEVRQPETLRDSSVQQALADLQPDLLIVVAYGLILPPKVLAIPKYGCWNVHASLLPRWRGAAPIQRALQAGDSHSGVCLMQMEKGLDTGPLLLQRQYAISAEETGGSLHDALMQAGAELLAEGLQALRAGKNLAAQPQSDQGVCYAHKLEKSEAQLDWQLDAIELERTIRAFNPWPIAEAQLGGERVRIFDAAILSATETFSNLQPGTIIDANKQGIDIACGRGVLRIIKLQRDGGKPMLAADYLNARPDIRKLESRQL